MGTFGEALKSQIGTQLGQAGGGALAQAQNRLFGKFDRKVNWKESQRYGERAMNWERQQAYYNQQLQKDFYDYTSAPEEVKRLKEAGLNPALIYETGGISGQTASATAQAPNETYKPMGLTAAQMTLRETEAERQLKLAQAENLRSQISEREGVERVLKEAQTQSITAGIESQKAKDALTRSQTISQDLSNRLKDATLENQKNLIEWTSRKAHKELQIAEDEAYMSKETRDDKISQIRRTLYNSVIESALKQATLTHINKQDDKLDAEIKNISNMITDRIYSWTISHKNYKLDELKYQLETQKLEIQKQLSKYVGIDKLAGKVFDKAFNLIFNGTNAIDRNLGLNPEPWR